MESVPARIGVAGDWHGNTPWAVQAVREISALLPAEGPRMIVHLGDFGIWPGAAGRQYLSQLDAGPADVMVTHECPAGVEHRFPPTPPGWAPADVRRSDVHRGLLREVVLGVRPRWLMHGHLHLSYQRMVDLGDGPIEVTGLDCDGANRGNWAILDVTIMRWLRFGRRPVNWGRWTRPLRLGY